MREVIIEGAFKLRFKSSVIRAGAKQASPRNRKQQRRVADSPENAGRFTEASSVKKGQ